MINLEKNEEQLRDSVMNKISLSKDKVKLEKHVVSLSKCVVNLSKKSEVDLGSVRARVVIALDDSGSMNALYEKGVVQEVLDRLVPLGLTFDDNGAIEIYRFSSSCKKLADVTLDNYEDYVEKVMKPHLEYMGTQYADTLKEILFEKASTGFLKSLLSFKNTLKPVVNDAGQPTFILFITDGENSDEDESREIIRQISPLDCFVQFIGIGKERFKFLRELDNLDGRPIDNTGFTDVSDIKRISDEDLYTIVLSEYAEWLRDRRPTRK
jgi:hypothetical protein